MCRQLEELIQRRRLQDCVILTGNQPNPYPYIKHADLLVHPSYVESQGLGGPGGHVPGHSLRGHQIQRSV